MTFFLKINVRKYQRCKQKWKIQINWQHRRTKISKNTILYTFQSSTSIMLWAEPLGIYSNFDTAIQSQTTTSYIGLRQIHYNVFLDMWPRTSLALMWNTVRCNQNKNKRNSKICNRLAKFIIFSYLQNSDLWLENLVFLYVKVVPLSIQETDAY
jgi:hypothetical protein